MSIGCAHAPLTMRDGMLRRLDGAVFTYVAWLYTCSSCYGACMALTWSAEACVVGRRTVGQRIVEHASVFTVCLCMSRVSRIEGMVRHGANLADVMKCLVDMKPPLQGEVSACSRPSQHQSAHTTLSRSKVMMLCGSLQQQLRQG